MNSNTKVYPAPSDSPTSYYEKNLMPRREAQTQNLSKKQDYSPYGENTNSELDKMIRMSDEQVQEAILSLQKLSLNSSEDFGAPKIHPSNEESAKPEVS